MTIDFILQVATLLGVVFAVFLYFKKPQERSEITDAVFDNKFINLEKTVVNLRDNHIHTLQGDLDKHIQDNQMFAIETTRSLTKVETLLEQLLKK